MPFDAWLLLVVSVGLGLTLEILYVRSQRVRRGSTRTSHDGEPGERR